MKIKQNRKCIGLCKEYLAKKPQGSGRYESGQFRCQVCEIYISVEGTKKNEGIYCKCCNYRVRGKPRNKIYKDKLRNSAISVSSEIKLCPRCGKGVKGKKNIEELFGFRNSRNSIIPQSYCRECRIDHHEASKKVSSNIKKHYVSKDVLPMIENLKELMDRKYKDIRAIINIFTTLYEKYGTVKQVSEISTFSERDVRKYVKYSRLPPTLQTAVQNGNVDLINALRATDALNWDGDKGMDDKILELSMKMKQFTSFEKNMIEKILSNDPSISISAAEILMKKSIF